MFVGVHHLANAVRPAEYMPYRNTRANVLATRGLTVSSLLYWNYMRHAASNKKNTIYALVCAFDYLMIATNSIVSTFPTVFRTPLDVCQIAAVFTTDLLRHYNTYGNVNTYYTHQACCILSTFVGLMRSVCSRQWSALLLRLYSTTLSSMIFYLSFAKMHTIQHFQQMPWYLPWLWHLHASICQQSSIEMAYHYHKNA